MYNQDKPVIVRGTYLHGFISACMNDFILVLLYLLNIATHIISDSSGNNTFLIKENTMIISYLLNRFYVMCKIML